MKILMTLLAISLYTQAFASPESDSGIQGKPYMEILQDLRSLKIKFPKLLKVQIYGKTKNNRPLVIAKISLKERFTKAILITGATHGNEYLNIADRLPKWFLSATKSNKSIQNYLLSGGAIFIVPIVNPDGYERRSRYNSNGKDLNRDFSILAANYKAFKQNETRMLTNYLESEMNKSKAKLQVSVDYHCCDGSLLYPWSYTKKKMNTLDLKRHIIIGELMKDIIDRRYKHGITGEVLGYFPKGTSKDYYYEKYKALSFTFEGKYGVEDRKFEEHTKWWTAILQVLQHPLFR